jgi:hypothetical protein
VQQCNWQPLSCDPVEAESLDVEVRRFLADVRAA